MLENRPAYAMEVKTKAEGTFIIWVEAVPFEAMSTKVLNELEVLFKISRSFIEKAELLNKLVIKGGLHNDSSPNY